VEVLQEVEEGEFNVEEVVEFKEEVVVEYRVGGMIIEEEVL